jgi:hypothetical protein
MSWTLYACCMLVFFFAFWGALLYNIHSSCPIYLILSSTHPSWKLRIPTCRKSAISNLPVSQFCILFITHARMGPSFFFALIDKPILAAK